MFDRPPLFVTRPNQILPARMHSRLGSHAPNHTDLVRLLRQILHRSAQLKARLGSNRLLRPLSRSLFRIQGINVRHPPQHLHEDHILRFPKTRTRSGRLHRQNLTPHPSQHRHTQRCLGPTFAKQPPTQRIKRRIQVHGNQIGTNVYSTKTNSRVLNSTQVKSFKVSPPSNPATASANSPAFGFRLKKLR